MRYCVDCAHFYPDKELCCAPQIADVAMRVWGKPTPGAAMSASEARVNGDLCGINAAWFVAKPEAAPSPPPSA